MDSFDAGVREGMEKVAKFKPGYYGNVGGYSYMKGGRLHVQTGHPHEFPGAKQFNMKMYKPERVGRSGKKYAL